MSATKTQIARCIRCESEFRPHVTTCPDCGSEMKVLEVEGTDPASAARYLRSLAIFGVTALIVGALELSGTTNMRGDVPWQVPPIFIGVMVGATYLMIASYRRS